VLLAYHRQDRAAGRYAVPGEDVDLGVRRSSAARIGRSLNWTKARPVKAISVTRKRKKCTETGARPASIAVATGSGVVLEDRVGLPTQMVLLMPAASHASV
jgi:hypothetical protein